MGASVQEKGGSETRGLGRLCNRIRGSVGGGKRLGPRGGDKRVTKSINEGARDKVCGGKDEVMGGWMQT